jgi:lysophospholipase L1-like esterase
MINKVLIFTDSLALPRLQPELCGYDDTWPELLRRRGQKVHQVSIGGATSRDLLNQVHYHISFDPDLVILQVGIVDCAPRFMTKIELSVVSRIPVIGRKIIGMMNTKKVRELRRISYVPIHVFEKNIAEITDQFKDKKVWILGIVPPTPAYELVLPGVTSNVNSYNSVLQKYGEFLALDGIEEEGIMIDHHHLNTKGHQYIFDIIDEKLKA